MTSSTFLFGLTNIRQTLSQSRSRWIFHLSIVVSWTSPWTIDKGLWCIKLICPLYSYDLMPHSLAAIMTFGVEMWRNRPWAGTQLQYITFLLELTESDGNQVYRPMKCIDLKPIFYSRALHFNRHHPCGKILQLFVLSFSRLIHLGF